MPYHPLRPGTLPYTFRRFRISNNISQKTLSVHLGVSENYIWMIENLLRLPSLALSMRFANFFRINQEYIKALWFNQKLLIEHLKYSKIFN